MLRPCEYTAYTLGLDGSEITRDETEFLLAMLAYQKRFRRRYPTWREVLHVARCLGYRKVAEPAINGSNPERQRRGESPPPSLTVEVRQETGDPPCPFSRAS